MNTKKQRIFSGIVCIVFVLFTFVSLIYIVKEADHHCTGEDCPVCINIQQVEQTLRNLGTGTIDLTIVNLKPVFLTLLIICPLWIIHCTTLVSQKVRLNN